jgi:hypothetical protein
MMTVVITRATAVVPYTVVAGGLVNPRGLTFAPGGRLYVSQAGTGGNTGKLTEIRDPFAANPTVRDVVTGLISEGDLGLSGISAIGNGNIYGIMGESNMGTGFTSQLGHLLQFNTGGQSRDVANVGDFDYQWAKDHINLAPRDFPDANPYGILALPSQLWVADAGSNTLDLVRPNGSIAIIAFFPNNAIADATPTCVAQGPDGNLYIGTLALADSVATGPKAKVFKVDPTQADPDNLATVLSIAKPWATGLFPINGCAFGPDGSFYVSELFTNPSHSFPVVLGNPLGDVVKIPFDSPAVHISLTGGALTVVGGVAVGADGTVFAANGTAFGFPGQVVKLTNK